jgi:hypothetical protein
MIKVTPRVVKDGNWIVLDWTSDRTTLPRFDTYITQIMVPQFVRLETESTMAVRNGQRTLLAFQKMPEVENQFELDIVEAWAEPIK